MEKRRADKTNIVLYRAIQKKHLEDQSNTVQTYQVEKTRLIRGSGWGFSKLTTDK